MAATRWPIDLSFRLDEQTDERLKAMAARRGTSRNALIREGLVLLFEREDAQAESAA